MEQLYTQFPILANIVSTGNDDVVFMKKHVQVGTGQHSDLLTFTKWTTSKPPTLVELQQDKILTKDTNCIHLAVAKEIVGYPGRLRYLNKAQS